MEAMAPTLEIFAMLQFKYRGMPIMRTVRLIGVDPESRSRLGGLFRPEDYPRSKDIRDKFAFETKVMPLPDAGSIPCTLAATSW